MNERAWNHKHLLDTAQLSPEDVAVILSLAAKYHDFNRQPLKKSDILKGKSVVLFFAENSTRTKTSFDMAAKRLSADTFALGVSGSSINKGESLKDTGQTLDAMHPDLIVIRHERSGAAEYLAKTQNCVIINAGDGWHAHPTQALLDLYVMNDIWQGKLSGKTLLILGDIAHSRVARSNLRLLEKLGVKVRLCAPRTLLPAAVESWPVEVFSNLKKAIKDVDAVMCLRLQLERQQSGLLPNLNEYSRRYCLGSDILRNAKPDIKILHPGPMNRDLEISDEIASSPACMALNQVEAGLAVRMALLDLFLNPSHRKASV